MTILVDFQICFSVINDGNVMAISMIDVNVIKSMETR